MEITARQLLIPQEEFWDTGEVTYSVIRFYRAEDKMIEFAKLHVEAALKAAGEKAKEIQRADNRKYVSAKAIINSYSLDNIK